MEKQLSIEALNDKVLELERRIEFLEEDNKEREKYEDIYALFEFIIACFVLLGVLLLLIADKTLL